MRNTKIYSFISNKLPFSQVIFTKTQQSHVCCFTLAVTSSLNIYLFLEIIVMTALFHFTTIWNQDFEVW
jgi:hypothetical protein